MWFPQTSTAVDNDEEPLLPQEHELSSLRIPPPGATQLEDVTDSLGAALGPNDVPRSRSDVDDEETADHVDFTFLDRFERDLGVLSAIHDGVHPHGGPVPEFGVPSASQEFVRRRCRGARRVGYNGRFAVVAEEEDSDGEVMLEVRACRRRVAASPSFPPTAVDPVMPTEVDMESAFEVGMPEEETESILSVVPESEVGTDEEVEVESEADVAPAMIRPSAHIQEGFISLDMVNVREVITIRSCVMVPPTFLHGAYRSAMRLALQEIVSGMEFQTVCAF